MDERVHFYEDIDIGDEIEELEICPTTADVVRYVEVARMQSGRFTDDAYARSEGLPGAIIPGNMSLGFLSRMVTEFFPTGTLRNLTANFRATASCAARASSCSAAGRASTSVRISVFAASRVALQSAIVRSTAAEMSAIAWSMRAM